MRISKALCYGLLLSLLLGLWGNTPIVALPLEQDAIWDISSPTEGSTVSGEVPIVGTATLPNFDSYGVLYAAGTQVTANSQWVPIVFGVKAMVVNGTLATWDTTQLPNGPYCLALAVYEQGNTEPKLHFVNNINVNNVAPTDTPIPTPEEPAAGQEATPTPSAEEAAPLAPTIEQPPTATPRPTPTLGANPTPNAAQNEENTVATLFPMEELKQTFCAGVYLAILIYILGGLYGAMKAALRYYFRQQHRKSRE